MRNYNRKKGGINYGKNKYTNKYTEDEVNFIIKNYKNMSNLQLSKQLFKSLHSIKDKMKRLKQDGYNFTRTQEEISNHRHAALKYMKSIGPGKYSTNNITWRKMVTLPDKKRILESHYILLGKSAPKGYVVHHKDMNPKNNSKDNLMLMTKAEHNRLHTSNNGIYGQLKADGKVTWTTKNKIIMEKPNEICTTYNDLNNNDVGDIHK